MRAFHGGIWGISVVVFVVHALASACLAFCSGHPRTCARQTSMLVNVPRRHRGRRGRGSFVDIGQAGGAPCSSSVGNSRRLLQSHLGR